VSSHTSSLLTAPVQWCSPSDYIAETFPSASDIWISFSAPFHPASLPTPLLLSSASFEPSPFVLFPCMVQALLLSLFFPQPCLHEGFESSFTVRSHESCANCTSASVGRDTHLWSPMLCKSASRPSKPLDAASRCDPPLHSVMCQDGFPTMHSLVRCQGKKKEQIICCRHRQTHYLWGRERSLSSFTESVSLPKAALGRVFSNWCPGGPASAPSNFLSGTYCYFANSGNFGKFLRKKKSCAFVPLLGFI